MEIETAVLKTPKLIFSGTKEQPVDADLILPDYYPEIAKILDCEALLSEEAVTVTADKVSVSGAAELRLTYTSADNLLKVYTGNTKYTRVIAGSSFESGDVPCVSQTVTAMNFRAVSPRKVEVRACAAVKAEVYRLRENEVIKDIARADIQKRTVEAPVLDISAFSSVRLELTQTVVLPVKKDEIDSVLNSSVRVSLNDTKTIHNKIMLSGVAEISFVYITKENTVSTEHSVSFPFSQIKDLFGVRENDVCDVAVLGERLFIDLKGGAAETEAAVFIQADILAVSGEKKNVLLIDDAYSVKTQMSTSLTDMTVPQCVIRKEDPVGFGCEVMSYDISVAEICDKRIADITYALSSENGMLTVTGGMTVKILAKTQEGAYYCFLRNASFEYETEKKYDECCCFIKPVPGNLRINGPADGKMECAGEVVLHSFSLQAKNRPLLTAVETSGERRSDGDEKIILYYGAAGESLWNIAKENGASLEDIKSRNALECDALEEDRLLVFRT